jgi:hypothetical protein
MSAMLENLRVPLSQVLPSIGLAVLILVAGWIGALIVRAILRRALGVVGLNRHLQQSTGSRLDLERGIAAVAYYFALALVLIAVLNALHLDRATQPLEAMTGRAFAYIPKLLAAGALAFIAWTLAMLVRRLVTRALAATTVDERLTAGADMQPIGTSAGNVLYWLILLLFLPAVLGTLELHGLLGPVQSMVQQILDELPHVLGALVILAVGWWVAQILRGLVTNLLAAAGADRVGARVGVGRAVVLSRLVGLVVYIAVLVPAVIAALHALRLEAVSGPAARMLEQMLGAVPQLIAAALILLIAWFVARLASQLAQAILEGIGLDRVPAAMGLGPLFAGAVPSQVTGRLIVAFVMLFATVEAAGKLGFVQIGRLVSTFIEFGSHVLLGTAMIAIGFWLSGLAHAAIVRTQGEAARGIASAARYGILGLVVAMGLRAMGLANDIVNLSFGLTLGGIAVALALAFGLGGREAAGRQMEHWLSRLRGEGR